MEPAGPKLYQGVVNAVSILRRPGAVLGMVAISVLSGTALRADDVVRAADDSGGLAWASIENDTYDQRAHFTAGAQRLSARLDEQIRQLKAKREAMTSDTKDWDFAMKAVYEARELLTGRISELAKQTTPETWTDARDKVGQAWKQSQQAVDNMNTTVTS